MVGRNGLNDCRSNNFSHKHRFHNECGIKGRLWQTKPLIRIKTQLLRFQFVTGRFKQCLPENRVSTIEKQLDAMSKDRPPSATSGLTAIHPNSSRQKIPVHAKSGQASNDSRTVNDQKSWCTRLDSNQWPSPSEGDALSS